MVFIGFLYSETSLFASNSDLIFMCFLASSQSNKKQSRRSAEEAVALRYRYWTTNKNMEIVEKIANMIPEHVFCFKMIF